MELVIEDIKNKEEELLRAIIKSDTEVLENLLHDDLAFTAPNGHLVTKEEDLESHKAGGMHVEYIRPDIENIKIYGNSAIVQVVYDTKGIQSGQTIEERLRYIRFWRKFDDGIKVVGGACTIIQD